MSERRACALATPLLVDAICRESASICARRSAAADRVLEIWLWRSPELGAVRPVPSSAADTEAATTARESVCGRGKGVRACDIAPGGASMTFRNRAPGGPI